MKFSYGNIFDALMMILIFSLAFLIPFVEIYAIRIPFSDFLFVFVLVFWLVGLLAGKFTLRFHSFFLITAIYLLALLISAIFSTNPSKSLFKFSGEIYLVLLAFLTFNYVTGINKAKNLALAWISGTVFVLLISLLTLFLFYADIGKTLLALFQNHYGTVPVGNYPRIKATFFHSNLLCNYLSVGLLLIVAAKQSKWLNISYCNVLIFLLLIISLFTFSPGLGGIAISLGIVFWKFFKEQGKTFFSNLCLITGSGISLIFLALLIFAMKEHPTAPFVVTIPLTNLQIFPSSRWMVWSATIETFVNNLWNGVGLGEDVCRVRYLNPSGTLEDLRDGHNIFLNVAAQTGLLGLIGITLIVLYQVKKIFENLKLNKYQLNFHNCCGLAILSAFIYQGLSSSFEETRHLWVLFGLYFSSESFDL